jgi:hypothetical protein
MQRVLTGRDIPLPAERDDGNAALHEQGVAVVVGGESRRARIASEVENEGRHSPAIHDVDHGEIRRVLGPEHDELAHGADFAIRIPRGQIEIDDLSVGGAARIKREIDPPYHSFVDVAAEGAGNVRSREDLHSDNSRHRIVGAE